MKHLLSAHGVAAALALQACVSQPVAVSPGDGAPAASRSAAVAPAPSASGARPGTQPDVDRAATGVKVTLVDPGAAPRRLLRHDYRAGERQRLIIETLTRVGGLPEVEAAPPMTLTVSLDAEVVSVSADGSARVSYQLGPVRSASPAADSASPGGGAQPVLRAVALLTARGFVAEHRVVDESSEGSLPSTLAEATEPLPAAPVGVGAVWHVRRLLEEPETRVEQVTEYRVVHLEERRVETRVTRAQRADDPSGPARTLVSTGELTLLLGRMFPTGALRLRERVELPGGAGAADLETVVSFRAE